MATTTVTLPMPSDPTLAYSQHFYMHYSDTAIGGCLNLDDNVITPSLCAAYGVQNYGLASWFPNNQGFSFFQYVCWPYRPSIPSTDPQYFAISSGVIFRGRTSISITRTLPPPPIPGSWDLQPGLNMIAVDINAVSVPITTWCNSTNTIAVYGNYDPVNDTNIPGLLQYYSLGQKSFVGGGLFDSISKFRPGEVYLIQAKTAFTISFPRRNAYLVTTGYNQDPSGPGYYITTNNTDSSGIYNRFITNQSSVTF